MPLAGSGSSSASLPASTRSSSGSSIHIRRKSSVTNIFSGFVHTVRGTLSRPQSNGSANTTNMNNNSPVYPTASTTRSARSSSSIDSNQVNMVNTNSNVNSHNRFNPQAYTLNMANSPTVSNLNGFLSPVEPLDASTPLPSQAEESESDNELNQVHNYSDAGAFEESHSQSHSPREQNESQQQHEHGSSCNHSPGNSNNSSSNSTNNNNNNMGATDGHPNLTGSLQNPIVVEEVEDSSEEEEEDSEMVDADEILSPPLTSGNRVISSAGSGMTGPMTGSTAVTTLRTNTRDYADEYPVPLHNQPDEDGFYSIRLTPYIDHTTTGPFMFFGPLIRKIQPPMRIAVGRYTERCKGADSAPQGSSAPVVFKSKVVSRQHAELSVDNEGRWFIKDIKSSSGTFVNHSRLSPAGVESVPRPLQESDIVQLGMDYRGGSEEIYRCVRVKVELNSSWKRRGAKFSKETHERLKQLTLTSKDQEQMSCVICLGEIKPCQSVFVSSCSHSWHYKCIRPLIVRSYPQFVCPNCKAVCDMEADLDDDDEM